MPAPPPSHDRELRDLLRTWEVETRDDPALARNIWARIQAGERGLTSTWLEDFSRLFTRPAAAFATVALFAALGAVAAEVRHSHRREAQVSQLAAEYARSIDPILMTHPANHAEHTP